MLSISNLFFESKVTDSLKKAGRKTMESGYITNKMVNKEKENISEKDKELEKKKDNKRLMIAGGLGLAGIGARQILRANDMIR